MQDLSANFCGGLLATVAEKNDADVFAHRIGANGRVETGGCVVPERCSANSGEMVTAGVLEQRSETNGQVVVGDAVSERLRSNGHVKVAAHVSAKCATTNRDVISAVSSTRKRIFTHGGIVDPSGDRVQRAVSHTCVSTPGTRAWAIDCFERRRKRKPGEPNCHCKKTATQWRAVNGTYQTFHFFVFIWLEFALLNA